MGIDRSSCLVLLIACLVPSCSRHKLFTRMDDGYSGIQFANTITESESFNVLTYPYIYNGGGVGVGDVNGDGLPDIFFTGNMVSCRLYLNKGGLRFEDITEKAGLTTTDWCTGIAMVDINGDGLTDIHVCTVNPVYGHYSRNHFFINEGVDSQGIPHFKDRAQKMGLADTAFSTQAAFLDYDGDGDLDMYLLVNGNVNFNRNEVRPIVSDGSDPATGRLYRNDGIPPGGSLPVFTDVSRQAGIVQQGWGLGVVICDIDKDGWPDIYVANDFLSNDQLLINHRDGTFTNDIARQLRHQSQNSMGVDAADINNDGLPDIVTVDMKPFENARDKSMFGHQNYDLFQLQLLAGYQPEFVRNSLQLNNGNNTFSEIGQLSGIYATDWSWSALLADFDNDGYRDLFITNGYGKDVTDLDYLNYMSNGANNMFGNDSIKKRLAYQQMNRIREVPHHSFLFRNDHQLHFTDNSEKWGTDIPSLSNGAVYADLDNDGDLDLVVNNLNEKAFIYRNDLICNAADSLSHRWLRVRLTQPGMNSEALGSKIELFAPNFYQYADLCRQRGFMSSVDNNMHFGLDSLRFVDSLRVTWPDGTVRTLKHIAANQLLRLSKQPVEPSDQRRQTPVPPPTGHSDSSFFQSVSSSGIDYVHREDPYVDFKTEPLIPYQYSRCGPGVAVGDIDGDRLDDIFIGGAAGHPNCLYIQQRDGHFIRHTFEAAKPYEDMGALLFDADGDGDMDLCIVSGGNSYPPGSPYYRSRLYRNDGKGNFTLDTAALPDIRGSGSVVIAADIDGDGDLDLFIGTKSEPHHYPLPGKSCLLRNDHGIFTDITDQWAPGLRNIGIITSALFSDYDNDGQVDLVLAGEWMPVTFFHNQKGHFTNVTPSTGIAAQTGWWNSLVAGDFDGDGDMDYIAGNMGLNTRYRASDTEPVSIYAKDFNEDGLIDPVMTYYMEGTEVTDAYRDDLIKQIIGVRRRFPYYSDFGKASFQQVFTPGELQNAYTRKCTWMRTSYIKNKGGGKFTISPLPVQAQTAPVYGMVTADPDMDGNLDVLLVGNQYHSNTLTGQYDAFNGLFLTGDGKDNFLPMTPGQAGFFNPGDGKALAKVSLGCGGSLYVVTNNDDSVRIFRQRTSEGRMVNFLPMDSYAILYYKNGRHRRLELNYGGGYLSQSSRSLEWTPAIERLEITDSRGAKRILRNI